MLAVCDRDHPRSRGVYYHEIAHETADQGSSPLARGLRTPTRPPSARTRIIPARAGFTHPYSRNIALLEDHPRSRGVYVRESSGSMLIGGSSPLARGLRADAYSQRARRGIIPARAGFTPSSGTSPRSKWDHPRSRGVYARMCILQIFHRGIIPARAGFTIPRGHRLRRHGDHPRSRGVYLTARVFEVVSVGSSPLARGLPHPLLPIASRARIIPARAGFTNRLPRAREDHKDHPRSRGVYAGSPPSGSASGGSSPLARGLLKGKPWKVFFEGIIPARAGFTSYDDVAGEGCADHPRSRGVYSGSRY